MIIMKFTKIVTIFEHGNLDLYGNYIKVSNLCVCCVIHLVLYVCHVTSEDYDNKNC